MSIFDNFLNGELSHDAMVKFLTDLSARGETADDLAVATKALRRRMTSIKAPAGAIDIVGTGGDGRNTLNISTAAAIVVAACGVPVAKHGNRAVSSKSGSSDVLSALGVNLDVRPEQVENILARTNLAFLMAPIYHDSMQIVAPVRKEIGQRTIFNLLGPLTNPANVKHHLIGVYDKKWLRPFATVLKNCGTQSAWIVHSEDGLDELTPTSINHVVTLKDGEISEFIIDPIEFGMSESLDDLGGGDAAFNAEALRGVLNKLTNAYRTSVLLNTAGALVVAGRVDGMQDGLSLAAEAIDSGAAYDKLHEFVRATHEQ